MLTIGGIKMNNKPCVVKAEDISIEYISNITKNQKNIVSPNERVGEESAFSKALNGSKIFLEAQGYKKESEE